MITLRTLLLAVAAFITVSTNAQSFIYHEDAYCGLDLGRAVAQPACCGPSEYVWNTGETTQVIDSLAPGAYSVSITDDEGAVQELSVTILMSSNMPVFYNPSVACGIGTCNGGVYVEGTSIGTALPMTYSVDPPQCVFAEPDTISWPFFAGAWIMNLEGGVTYTVTVTDANGCSGTVTNTIDTLGPGNISGGWPIWSNVVDQIVGECGGTGNGSFRLIPQADWGGDWELIGVGGIQNFNFAEQPYIFTGLAAGTYRVRRHLCGDVCVYWGNCEEVEVVIPSIPEPCSGVNGRIVHDADEDCVQGSSDIELPFRVLTIEPGPHYAFSGPDGAYWKNLPDGSYTIEQALTDEVQVCPPNAQEPFVVNTNTPLATVDFFNLSTVPHDLSVWMYGPAPHVGFPTWVNIFIHNNSAFYSGDVTLDLSYDTDLLDPSITAPVQLGVIPPYGEVVVQFTAQVSPDIFVLDDQLIYTAILSNTVAEPNTINNTATLQQTIIGAFDPNNKTARTSSDLSTAQYFLDQDEWLDYTVRFQNTGTAAAQTVVIRDTLDADLSIASIQILGASHAFTPSFGDDRELVFTFNNINLPDSGSDYLGSQGFIGYRIKPENGIVLGDVIENSAAIYFDFNPPVITNTVAHVVDFSTAVVGPAGAFVTEVEAWPNPTGDFLNILVKDPKVRILGMFDMRGARFDPPFEQRSTGGRLDVRGLPVGMYAVSTTAGSVRFVKK